MTARAVPAPFFLNLLTAAALLVCLGLSVGYETGGMINHDVSTFIYNARQILFNNKIPYVDLIDMNPPMSTWLYMPPVWLAHELGWTSAQMVQLCRAEIYLLLLAGFALSAHLLRTPAFGLGPVGWRLALVVLAFVLLPGSATFFGQREQLILALMLPQLLSSCRASMVAEKTGQPAALLAALFAFIAIAMKPHYILPLMLAELVVLARRRSLRANFRSETLALLALGLLYSAIIYVFCNPLLNTIPQLALRYYWAIGSLTWKDEVPWLCLLAALLLLRLLYGRFGKPQIFDGLLAAVTGCYAAYLALRMGFTYQRMPFAGLAALWIVLACPHYAEFRQSRLAQYLARRNVRTSYTASLLLALSLMTGMCSLYESWQRAGMAALSLAGLYTSPEAMVYGHMTTLLRQYPDAKNIFFMSGQIWAFPTVVYEDIDVSCRWGFMWMVPAEQRLPPEQRGYVVEGVVADFERYKPQIVLVDIGLLQPGLPMGFDFIKYFSQWPAFRKIWAHYEAVPPNPEINQGTYLLYKRID